MWVKNIVLAVLAAFAGLLGFMLFQFLCNDIAYDVLWATGWVEQSDPIVIQTWGEYLFDVVMLCAFPAILEEMIFRWGVFGGLLLVFNKHHIKHGAAIAICTSALVFAIYHWSFEQLVYQFIMGVVFAAVYFKTKRIIYPIIVHFINNFAIITYTFIAGHDGMNYAWGPYTLVATFLLAIIGAWCIMGLVGRMEAHETR